MFMYKKREYKETNQFYTLSLTHYFLHGPIWNGHSRSNAFCRGKV